MNLNKVTLTIIFGLSATLSASAITQGELRFHNINTDTTTINNVLDSAVGHRFSNDGDIISFMAEKFIDSPYKGGTLEGEKEITTINTEEFDCTTLVETVLALAMTAKEHRTSWRDFATHLRDLRYRGGVVDGYASRLHYISDWIIDNNHRGILEEVTPLITTSCDYKIKSLDFMSDNRSAYPALEDSTNFANIKHIENGYRSHRFPYIKPANLTNTKLQTGDIIFFVTKKDGLDVSHAGIIKMVDGVPYLLHASSAAKKVVTESKPLNQYFKRNPSVMGFRIVRLRQ